MVCNCGFWSLLGKIGFSVRLGMTEGWVELHSFQGIIDQFSRFFPSRHKSSNRVQRTSRTFPEHPCWRRRPSLCIFVQCKDLYMRDTTVFILCETIIVQRSAAKYFCLARCGSLCTFLLFRLRSRAKTTTDNDQPPFLWHGQCKLFTKVTSVCILMYKLLLYPETSCLVWSFKTNAALKLRPFPIYHPLISSLRLVPLSGIVRSFDWL